MKKLMTIFGALIFASTILTSCGGSNNAEKNSTLPSKNERKEESASSGDCKEFLAGYEKFMNDYITILTKYKNNPTDASVLSEYTTMMSKASEWSTKTADCASDPEFASKFVAIQTKIANAASGM